MNFYCILLNTMCSACAMGLLCIPFIYFMARVKNTQFISVMAGCAE